MLDPEMRRIIRWFNENAVAIMELMIKQFKSEREI